MRLSDAAQILNVIARTEPRNLLAAWRAVFIEAHPGASENEANQAYAEACAELEAI